MTLLSVVKDVCAVVGVAAPTAVIPTINSNRTMFEMLQVANEMAQRIAYDTREWSMLKTQCVFTGTGVNEAFNLPVDFKRMLITTNVWRSTSTQTPMRFFPNIDEWLQRRISGSSGGFGEWTIYGGQMHIEPILQVSEAVRFPYLHRNCINSSSSPGDRTDRFVNDNDTFALDERVLKLGMIWQWKSQKGSPYAEDMGTYSDALVNAMGPDSPAPIIVDRLPISAWSANAYLR